jgi:DNA-binding CsgD family transcriptional regulator
MHQLQLMLQDVVGPSPAALPKSAEPLSRHSQWPSSGSVSRLTARRRQVLILYLSGETRKSIARHLGVSPHTVRNHIRAVYEELDVTNRIEALRWALQQPTLADPILQSMSTTQHEIGPSARPSSTHWSVSVADLIAEAIDFFQYEVIHSSTEFI